MESKSKEAARRFRRKFENEFIPEISERDKIEVAFLSGVQWQLDNMWISADIIPEDGVCYLVRCKNGSIYLSVHEEGIWKNTNTVSGIEIPNVEAYLLMRKYNKDEL